ncbi:MAG: ATP cone domain-containing protein [Planctomycetota bacterium]|nr:ATP cone domain-containing protein [Planctomycetota bacterium]
MRKPDAVRKYDGRLVAFNPLRLVRSLARAALACGAQASSAEAKSFGEEIARAACEFLAQEYGATPSTADVRELTVKLLRETGHHAVADAYAEHARAAASLLWSLRLTDGHAPEGSPWDRRRLIESLRGSGIAADPAGEISRQVERKLVALGVERGSAALVHALAVLELQQRAMDARRYAARRVAASFAPLAERWDALAARGCPLPHDGPALEAFWLQAVHSDEVALAARGNLLGLAPYPASPEPAAELQGDDRAADPLGAEGRGRLRAPGREPLWVRADGPERVAALAEALAGASAADPEAPDPPGAQAELVLVTVAPSLERSHRPVVRSLPITLNVGGLLIREAIRDPQKATLRLTQLVALAAQAHREREEYFGRSPIRGRELPLVPAGLWNAAAWLAREPFAHAAPSPTLRAGAATLASALHGVVSTLREETGLNLALIAGAPRTAAAALWAQDGVFLAQDGATLDPLGSYEVGLELRVSPGVADLGERVDFLKSVAGLFDEPSALALKAPLGREPDASAWREVLDALRQTGLPRVRLLPGGSPRGARLLARLIRGHLEGFPLFERLGGS